MNYFRFGNINTYSPCICPCVQIINIFRSSTFSARITRSSANNKQHKFVPLISIPTFKFFNISTKSLIYIENRLVESESPCLTPLSTLTCLCKNYLSLYKMMFLKESLLKHRIFYHLYQALTT